jgi:hypothetical protein
MLFPFQPICLLHTTQPYIQRYFGRLPEAVFGKAKRAPTKVLHTGRKGGSRQGSHAQIFSVQGKFIFFVWRLPVRIGKGIFFGGKP